MRNTHTHNTHTYVYIYTIHIHQYVYIHTTTTLQLLSKRERKKTIGKCFTNFCLRKKKRFTTHIHNTHTHICIHIRNTHTPICIHILTVCVIYMAIFEYQNQVIFNMTVSDGEPRCQIDTCFWCPNKNVFFGILKASHFQY